MKNKIVITTDGTETLARLYERSIYFMTQLIFKEGTNLPNMILQKKYNETFERRGNSIYVNFYNSKEGCRGTLIVDQSNVSIIILNDENDDVNKR